MVSRRPAFGGSIVPTDVFRLSCSLEASTKWWRISTLSIAPKAFHSGRGHFTKADRKAAALHSATPAGPGAGSAEGKEAMSDMLADMPPERIHPRAPSSGDGSSARTSCHSSSPGSAPLDRRSGNEEGAQHRGSHAVLDHDEQAQRHRRARAREGDAGHADDAGGCRSVADRGSLDDAQAMQKPAPNAAVVMRPPEKKAALPASEAGNSFSWRGYVANDALFMGYSARRTTKQAGRPSRRASWRIPLHCNGRPAPWTAITNSKPD